MKIVIGISNGNTHNNNNAYRNKSLPSFTKNEKLCLLFEQTESVQ